MKKFMLPLALGVSLLGMGLINQTKSSAQGKTSPKIVQTAKKPAPAFKLKNKKGKIVSLSDYKGKKVYINVWATWCGPCMQEIPGLKKVYQAYKGKKNFVFLSVTSPSDLKYQNNNPIDKERSTILAKAKKKELLILFFTTIKIILLRLTAFALFQPIFLLTAMAVFRKRLQAVLTKVLLNTILIN